MDIQELVKFAKESQAGLTWDTSSLIRVGGLLAAKVNTIQNLSGSQKQKLVCQILKQVLDESGAASLKQVVDDVVPASLELALAAARGKLDLKKVKMSVWVKYFSCCAHSVVTLLVSQKVISQDQAKQAESALAAVEAKASEVASQKDAAAAEEEKKEEDKFEQTNPMHSETSESSTQESKDQESQKSE